MRMMKVTSADEESCTRADDAPDRPADPRETGRASMGGGRIGAGEPCSIGAGCGARCGTGCGTGDRSKPLGEAAAA